MYPERLDFGLRRAAKSRNSLFLLDNSDFRSCESAHSTAPGGGLSCADRILRDRAISDDKAFDDCVILDKDAFDPDAVFLDDIVDDEVLPYLSLEVEGLTEKKDDVIMRPEDAAANDAVKPDTTMPVAKLDPEILEVYGWESSWWKKIKGYLGF